MSRSIAFKRLNVHRAVLLGAVAGSFLAAAPAVAQTASASDDPAANAGGSDIVVTARKRNESAIDVPIALTVFSADTLEKSNVKGLQDLQNSVPGLFYQERGAFQTYVSIRGVGGDARNIGLESGVTVAIDGVSSGRSNSFNMDLAEIAQVEVLRGPQGTLFGTNTIGGVINITTQKPTADTRISANVSYGNFETARSMVSASGPLTDTLFIGGAVSSWNSRGYIYNSTTGTYVQGQNRLGGRLQLRWVPNDRLEVYVTGDTTRSRRQETLSQCAEPFIGACLTDRPPNRYTITAASRNFNEGNFSGVNGTVDYELGGGFSVKSITSYRSSTTDLASDGDATTALLAASGPFSEDLTSFSQELRLVSPANKRFRFVGGLFYSSQDVEQLRRQTTTFIAETSGAIDTKTYAAYFNADFDVTDFLTLNGGVRQNREEKDGRYSQFRSNSTALTYNFPSFGRTDEGTSWTGSVKVKFNPNVSSYVTVSRGFKSGGFNIDTLGSAGLTVANIIFRPESVTNYEAGLKTILFDRKLRLNLAVFQLDYSDRQVTQFVDPGAGALPFVTIGNAASSRTRGFEADATLSLPAGWSLTGSFSYLDAKYRDFRNATAAGADFTGNITEQTPNYTGYIGVDNTTDIGGGRLIVHADASYNGRTYFDPANNPLNVQDGYWLLNGRIGYEKDLSSGGNTVGIFAFVKNATNQDFFLFKRQAVGTNQGVYGNPRFYGLQLTYKH
ncbi:TonB-dependent receptor [Sphingobium fuliginis]|uniref:Outer membrane receptor protein n=1 Tax=Sphingobium fuliginis (strain ATCC 27551) TaxID=336203 RepID=A0A292ZIT5_SPHSA|nr:TonB-dependent receptor [Sphingobium fuliginis]GAY22814.1 outer membrane receptor protein [Sphingobium fuliginis]